MQTDHGSGKAVGARAGGDRFSSSDRRGHLSTPRGRGRDEPNIGPNEPPNSAMRPSWLGEPKRMRG